MNSMFGEWYRQADIEPKPGELGERWKTIEALKATSEPEYAANLVRVHFSLPGLPGDFPENFRKAFFDVDNTFRMSGNDNEMRVLAGAILSEIIERNDTFADGVSLVVLAAAFPEFRKRAPLEHLLTAAHKHLFERAISVRHVARVAKATLADVETGLNTMKKNLAAGTVPNWPQIEGLLRSLNGNITEVSKNADARLGCWQRQHEVLLEESNIIWWVFGGAAKGSLKQFSDLSPAESALIAAKDLASLTHIIPPLVASPVFLERVLGDHATKSITLEEVAGLTEYKRTTPSSNLFPLAHCFAATDGGKTAKAAATASTKTFQLRTGGLEAKLLSLQFFRESLAERFLHQKG